MQKSKKKAQRSEQHNVSTPIRKEKKSPLKFVAKDKNNITCHTQYPAKNADGSSYDAHMQDITGTSNPEVALDIFNRGINAMPRNQSADYNCNVIVQSLNDFEPKNAIEARLCTQATALQASGMDRLSTAQDILDSLKEKSGFERIGLKECYREELENAMKLLRLANDTRRGNEQRYVVQHQYVQVNEGGKAIVGSQMNSGGSIQTGEECHGL